MSAAKRKATEPFDIVGMGMCVLDFISLVEKYPGSNEKAEAAGFANQGGSPAPTALVVAAKWGARTSFIGALGDDDHGRAVIRELEGYGIDTSRIIHRPGRRTPLAFVTVEKKTGNRAIVFNRMGMPLMKRSEVLPLPACRFFHTDARDTDASIDAMRAARRAGAEVMIDAGSVRPRMDELIAASDYFIASQEFMRKMFGGRISPAAACRRLLAGGPKLAMVTLGSKGCIGVTREDAFQVDAHRRENFIVDTTGAGDVFHGAFLYGLTQGWDVRKCAEVAGATSFLKCGQLGGRTGIPTLNTALRLAKESRARPLKG